MKPKKKSLEFELANLEKIEDESIEYDLEVLVFYELLRELMKEKEVEEHG